MPASPDTDPSSGYYGVFIATDGFTDSGWSGMSIGVSTQCGNPVAELVQYVLCEIDYECTEPTP
jgi:hypothetical protein